MSKLPYPAVFSSNVAHTGPRNPPQFHDSADGHGRYIGVEMEIMASNPTHALAINEVFARWGAAVVGDGSLPNTGYEINTAPARAEKFNEEIVEICRTLRLAGGRVNKQCGLHVHVDTRDLDPLALKRVIMTYLAVEDDVYRILAPSRFVGGWCRKAKDNGFNLIPELATECDAVTFSRALETKLYGNPANTAHYKMGKGNSFRYTGLNIHSHYHRGTLEFRHHHGSINAVKIIAWGRICEAIIEFGKRNAEKDIRKFFDKNPEPLPSILSPVLKTYFLERKAHFEEIFAKKKRRETRPPVQAARATPIFVAPPSTPSIGEIIGRVAPMPAPMNVPAGSPGLGNIEIVDGTIRFTGTGGTNG